MSFAAFVTFVTFVIQQASTARPGWPCVGKPDPSMISVSEASGGQMFQLDPSELGLSATLLTARDGLDEVLRRVVGEAVPGVHTTEVAVDGSVERVLFSVSLQCLQEIDVVRPSGAVVTASDPDVTWTAFQAGRQVAVQSPEAGTWTIRLAGEGLRFLVVHARASLALEGARIVRKGGRPGHEGLFDDPAPLEPGTRRLMEIRVSKGLLRPSFEMRASDDAALGALAPASHVVDDHEQMFLFEFEVPRKPFRVVVTGRDRTGKTVQRVQESLFILGATR
jgi:hypothetical protein